MTINKPLQTHPWPPEIDPGVAYWDRRPCNVRHSPEPPGSPEWSSQVTQRKYFVESHIPGFADFRKWRGRRVLELGCGIGTDTLQFWVSGADITAVDSSAESLKLAESRIPSAAQIQPRFVHDDLFLFMERANILRLTYDLIYSFGVLHHTWNPLAAIAMTVPLLASGGELRIMVYARYSIKFLLGHQPEAQEGCPRVSTFTALELRRHLGSLGMSDISIHKTHIFPWVVEDYVEYRYRKTWPYRWMPGIVFRGLERIGGHHLLVRARKP